MATAPVAVVARSRAAHVAMGKSVFFWGGQDGAGNALDDGAIYTPGTDAWVSLPSRAGSPSARVLASAVWTGSVVVVCGGSDVTGSTAYRDGSVFNPADNSWTALPAAPAGVVLSRRSAPFGFWDGARAVFWGGLNAQGAGVTGADRFEPLSKTWSVSSGSGEPPALTQAAVAADGSTLYLQGGLTGSGYQDKVYSYAGESDTWTTLSKSLSARSSAFAAWDGSRFVVWGGRDNALRNDGSALSGVAWTTLVSFGAPSARMVASPRRSGWSFGVKPGVVAILGGQTSLMGAGTFSTNGASYDSVAAQWSSIPSWPSGESHEYGMGVWTGDEFVLWGGRNGMLTSAKGERWSP